MKNLKVDEYKSLLRENLKELPVSSINLMLNGLDALVFDINDSIIVKIPRRDYLNEQFEKEVFLLQFLYNYYENELMIPKIIYKWPKTEILPYNYFGYQKIPGRPLTKKDLTRKSSEIYGKQIANFLTILHTIPITNFQNTVIEVPNTTDWTTIYQKLELRTEKTIFPLIHMEIQNWIKKTFNEFLSLSNTFNPVLLHGDLMKGNIIINSKEKVITGIIDWGDSRIGDPALDFASLSFDYGDFITKKVLTNYDRNIDKDFMNRIHFYKFCYLLYTIDLGLETKNNKIITKGLNLIKRSFHYRNFTPNN